MPASVSASPNETPPAAGAPADRVPATQPRHTGATGGWFSLWRVATALALAALAADAVHAGGATWVVAVWVGLAVAFGLGWTARQVTVSLALAILFETDVTALADGHAWFLGLLTVVNTVPPAPYGSWSARGRMDPGEGWRLPVWRHRAAGALAVLWWAFVVWWALAATAPDPLSWSFYAAGLLTHWLALQPGWIDATGPAVKLVGYDGHCGLCHRAVRFLLAEDPAGALRFAPLQGPSFADAVPEATRSALPDSVVVVTEAGDVVWKAAAAKLLLVRLGGGWRVMGHTLSLVPTPLLDLAYDAVAAVRHRIFARPPAACPLLPPELRTRFLP